MMRVCALILLALVCAPMLCEAASDMRVGPDGAVPMDDEVVAVGGKYPSATFNDTVVLLEEFQNSMVDPLSVNWKFPVNGTYCKDWHGIKCGITDHPDAITSLTLSGVSLGGTIPETLGTVLTLLQTLDLSDNPNLHGTLEQNVFGASDFINLVTLRIRNTAVEGPIPDLTQHENLAVLDLSHNQLTGPVPAPLVQLASLAELRLNNNSLAYDLPNMFIAGVELHTLDLQFNGLTGPFPNTLFGATGLASLRLNNNNFTGVLPDNTPPNLVDADVRSNLWTCDIPTLWVPYAGTECVPAPVVPSATPTPSASPTPTPSSAPTISPTPTPSQLPLKPAGHGAGFIAGMVLLSLVCACGVVYGYWRYRRRFAGFDTM